MKITAFTTSGKKTTKEVKDELFGQPINKSLLAQAIRVYLANQRQGSKSVQTRSEVSRTKAKWYKQKGTGNARHGSRNAHIFVGGGVAHGPSTVKSWNLNLPTTLKKKALVSALSLQAENVVITDAIENLDGKTKTAAKLIDSIEPNNKKVLVVISKSDPKILRSLRNLEKVLVTKASRINALEVSMADVIVMTNKAILDLELRILKSETKKVK